jgi:ribonuclease-3
MRREPSQQELQRVAELIGLEVRAPHLAQALTHPSWANERPGAADNQRLEFLGDAVLGMCASELLWERFPDADEGTLTRMRAQLVSGEALAAWARQSGIAQALRLGRGADATGLRDSPSVLADAVEALLGAAFLDGGLEVARAACRHVVAERLERVAATPDPKSALQELLQAESGEAPSYVDEASGGAAHDPWFEVTVRHRGVVLGRARGRSKRQAERAAAAAALEQRRMASGGEHAASDGSGSDR